MHVHLPFDHRKATQALNFLAQKSSGHIKKLKAIKIIFFADRYHLRKYGRPVTNDEYFAMPYGPVNSGVKDLAEMSHFLGEAERDYAVRFIAPEGFHVRSLAPVDADVFSESDLEALSFAWDRFGRYDEFQLADLSHHYPEWARFKGILEGQSRARMDYEDFLKDPPEGYEKCFVLSKDDRRDRLEDLKESARLNEMWEGA